MSALAVQVAVQPLGGDGQSPSSAFELNCFFSASSNAVTRNTPLEAGAGDRDAHIRGPLG